MLLRTFKNVFSSLIEKVKSISMGWKKIQGKIEIERYKDGKLGIILPKVVKDKFDEVFEDKAVDVSLSLTEDDKKMIIYVELPKQGYIM